MSIDNPTGSQYDAVHLRAVTRIRPPKKEVEAALRYAEMRGWRVVPGGGHAWGKMYCPRRSNECRYGEFCVSGINSTPRNAGNHARQIRRILDNGTAKDD